MDDILVIARFREEIQRHLLFNYLSLPTRPLMLGIFGRPGDGKTAQLSATFVEQAVQAYRVNAADLEDKEAGEPAKLIRRTYQAASLDLANGVPAAVVLDDIDTTVGEWQLNTGTVNHQQILAELMHLADQPSDPVAGIPRRVPVFVTGNHLGKLYAPLRRHRRMSHFAWRPTPTELGSLVQRLFHGYAEPDAAPALLRQYQDRPIAFYAEVRHVAIERSIQAVASLQAVSITFAVTDPDNARRHVTMQRRRFTGDDLLSCAESLVTGELLSMVDHTAPQPAKAPRPAPAQRWHRVARQLRPHACGQFARRTQQRREV